MSSSVVTKRGAAREAALPGCKLQPQPRRVAKIEHIGEGGEGWQTAGRGGQCQCRLASATVEVALGLGSATLVSVCVYVCGEGVSERSLIRGRPEGVSWTGIGERGLPPGLEAKVLPSSSRCAGLLETGSHLIAILSQRVRHTPSAASPSRTPES